MAHDLSEYKSVEVSIDPDGRPLVEFHGVRSWADYETLRDGVRKCLDNVDADNTLAQVAMDHYTEKDRLAEARVARAEQRYATYRGDGFLSWVDVLWTTCAECPYRMGCTQKVVEQVTRRQRPALAGLVAGMVQKIGRVPRAREAVIKTFSRVTGMTEGTVVPEVETQLNARCRRNAPST